MGARNPEQVDSEMAAAFQARDAKAVADLYEDDAVYAMSIAGYSLMGRAAIHEDVTKMFEQMSEVELVFDTPVRRETVGDQSFVHGTSTTRFTLADGSRHEVMSRHTNVLRRGSDGNWRIAIAHASSI